jgi:hypothetical protein
VRFSARDSAHISEMIGAIRSSGDRWKFVKILGFSTTSVSHGQAKTQNLKHEAPGFWPMVIAQGHMERSGLVKKRDAISQPQIGPLGIVKVKASK